MRLTQLAVAIGFMAVPTAWAGGQVTSTPALPASVNSPSTARQQLVSRQVEVKRLKQDLSRQESDSRRASERLQQQDQAIDELKKQLHELQAKSVPDPH